ncbi:hypothetical protein [Candidatus Nitrosocosmicus sp. R]
MVKADKNASLFDLGCNGSLFMSWLKKLALEICILKKKYHPKLMKAICF